MDMRTGKFTAAAACTLFAASQATAALYTFEATDEFTNNFSGFSDFSQSTTGGIADSGSVALTSNSQIAVEQTAFDASAGSFSVSASFKYNGANSGGRGFFVGLTSDPGDTYGSSATSTGTDLRLAVTGSGSSDNYGLQLLNNGGAFATSSLNVPLVDGEYYELVLNIGTVAGGSFTGISGQLFDSGGNSLKFLNDSGSNYTEATVLTSDTEAYAYFGGQNPASRAASNADNFNSPSTSGSVIPEPGSLGLLALGSLLIIRHKAQS
ncbi:MAG: hypothetical protein AAGI68_00110 [Planctomycetota bacterium]